MSAGTAGHGRFRASQADRERAIEVLKTAFVEDRLTKEELDLRVGQVLTSRTYAELAVVTADIPADIPAGLARRPPREPARAPHRPPMHTAVKAGICVAVAIAVAAVMAVLTGGMALLLFVPFYFMAMLAAGAQMLDSWHSNRSRGELPPRPGHDGQEQGRPDHGSAGTPSSSTVSERKSETRICPVAPSYPRSRGYRPAGRYPITA